ncbi:MAG: aminopeptidase P family protein [Coriobacteriales bacterium]|jgi:Xaa-Pro aminopeptidase|nr:aminopeptidase P family protein [Coriobacteriales bacterium]
MSEQRICRLLDTLEEKRIDAYLATRTADIRWLTDFSGVFDEEQAHLALILRPASRVVSGAASGAVLGAASGAASRAAGLLLFTDTRYSAALRALNRSERWRILDERRPRFAYVVDTLKTMLPAGTRAKPLRIGIESSLRLDAYRALSEALDKLDKQEQLFVELVELSDLVMGLRAKKDDAEIEHLKAAQALTDAAFSHMLGFLEVGLTEREAATELEFFMRRAGADGVAFASIVASGPNSALPHALPGKRVIERGDFVLMDFGARLDDYRSDMTRTVVMGAADEQQRAMYEAVLAAQSAVVAMLAPGVSGLEAQNVAEAIIGEHGFEGAFTHSLGHGVGIDIHELPQLAPKVTTALETGNVITVEPGVYLEGVGGVRIEDYGVITEHGFDPFTHSPHELIEL